MLKKITHAALIVGGIILTGCASLPAAEHQFAPPFGLSWGMSQSTLADRLARCRDGGYQVKCELTKVARPLPHPGKYFVTFTRPYGLSEVRYEGVEGTAADLDFIARQVKMINQTYPHSEKANWVYYPEEHRDIFPVKAHLNKDLICGRDRHLCVKSLWRYTLPEGEIHIEAGNYYQGKFPRITYRWTVPQLPRQAGTADNNATLQE